MATILMISGSVRVGSVNSAALATAAVLLPAGHEIIHYSGLGELPHFNPDLDHDPLPAPVAELRSAIAGASALLFSTPEYAGAMPGALKNLLEWTVGGVEISDKPTGWINPSTGPTGAAGTYASLGTVLNYTGAALVPEACRDIPITRATIGEDGLVHDASIRASITETLTALLSAIL